MTTILAAATSPAYPQLPSSDIAAIIVVGVFACVALAFVTIKFLFR